jgi:hypothetical protein
VGVLTWCWEGRGGGDHQVLRGGDDLLVLEAEGERPGGEDPAAHVGHHHRGVEAVGLVGGVRDGGQAVHAVVHRDARAHREGRRGGHGQAARAQHIGCRERETGRPEGRSRGHSAETQGRGKKEPRGGPGRRPAKRSAPNIRFNKVEQSRSNEVDVERIQLSRRKQGPLPPAPMMRRVSVHSLVLTG